MKKEKSTWKIFGVKLSRGLWITILLIPLMWIATLFLLFTDNENFIGEIGVFGDMFGAVNALFSGFAFIGIIISIRMQSDELELQRTELKETKQEFKNQNFQTTFFNLLRTQREIINEFSINLFYLNQNGNVVSRKSQGRGLFHALKKELRKIEEALSMECYVKYNAEKIEVEISYYINVTNQDQAEELARYIENVNKYYTLDYYGIDEAKFNEFKSYEDKQIIEKLKFIYERFFRKNEFAISHYFRHFYHMLRFLDKSEKQELDKISNETDQIERGIEISKEFLEYAEFIKAQVDVHELVLLFYNSLNYPKAKSLFIKYQIFDVLYIGNLIQKEHDVVTEYNIYKVKEDR